MKRRAAVTLAMISIWLGAARSDATEIVNGSFESGNFTGWTTADLSRPFFTLSVGGAGRSPGFGFFTSAPTDGSFAALHGFDGNGPGTIRIAQDVTVTADGTLVEFDYRAAWNLINYCFGCSDRLFAVNIEPAGGGPALLSLPILTARAHTIVLDTGNQVGVVDLSAFVGQTIRLSFDFFVPNNFSGPAFFQLDNVRVRKDPWIANGSVRDRDLARGLIRWKHIIGLQVPGNTVGTGGGQTRGASEPWSTEESDEGALLDLRRQVLNDSERRGSFEESDEGALLDLRRQVLTFGVHGLSLAGGNGIGTTGGIREIRGTLVCDADGSGGGDSVLVDTPPVQLSLTGQAFFRGSVAPLPAACDKPDIAFVIRAVTKPAPPSSAAPAPSRVAPVATSSGASSPEYPPRSHSAP